MVSHEQELSILATLNHSPSDHEHKDHRHHGASHENPHVIQFTAPQGTVRDSYRPEFRIPLSAPSAAIPAGKSPATPSITPRLRRTETVAIGQRNRSGQASRSSMSVSLARRSGDPDMAAWRHGDTWRWFVVLRLKRFATIVHRTIERLVCRALRLDGLVDTGIFNAMQVDLELPIRGLAAGLIIAAPVGPVNVLCIHRTLENGWRSGMLSGVGAALADTMYGAAAGFGITLVIQFLIGEEFWIRLIGGILLTGIGVVYYFKPVRPFSESTGDSSGKSDLASTFLLCATNPTTVLSFLAVLATLGLGRHRPLWQTSFLVAGIFCGSMTWWTILATTANLLRDRITDRAMGLMNRVAGIAIGCFGLVNVVLSRGLRH